MLKLTFFDKLKILFELVLSSPFFIFLFIFSLLALCILLDLKDKNKKKMKISIVGIYIIVLLAMIIKYHTEVFSVIDYFVNNIFILFYFPNLAIYVAMMIFTNIFMFKSLSFDKKEPIRVINLSFYTIIMYLSLLIVYTISHENLDVYSQESLYTNANVLALVELSNILFFIWIVIMIIDKLEYLLENKGVIKPKRNRDRIITKVVKEEVIKEVPVEKEVIRTVEVPVEREVVKTIEVPVEKVIYKDKQDEIFTKDDYVIMSKILKRIQEDYSK